MMRTTSADLTIVVVVENKWEAVLKYGIEPCFTIKGGFLLRFLGTLISTKIFIKVIFLFYTKCAFLANPSQKIRRKITKESLSPTTFCLFLTI